jgi:hypothetical protein
MNITINGKDYMLDFNAAIANGVLKEDKSIKDINPGDLFQASSYRPMLIIKNGPKYHYLMCDYDIDDNLYTHGKEYTRQGLIDYLNGIGAVFVSNIGTDIANIVNKKLKVKN